eukprot:TRINITY_DN10286_c0_g1_i1.p2 TRINITY_DN10286_c0_g1~~TRINITY_DN10286_c0_g1_i1.p2  ORF type:complete len:123 (-),score=3.76 TRINITY_DN10286_c0_g1_i1:426-794(-)
MVNKVYALANQKGGVGKTTSCINLAAALAANRQRVLLMDMDPQGNATMGSGIDKHTLTRSMVDLLLAEVSAQEVILPVLCVVVSTQSTGRITSWALTSASNRSTILRVSVCLSIPDPMVALP